MDKMLILGCGGMLGKAMMKVFPDAKYTDIDHNEICISYLDIKDFYTLAANIKEVDIVINLAAITDMEKCEYDKNICYETNYVGAKNVADLCAVYDKELVYVSTAGIFSGNKEFFTDKDKPEPRSHYAISKYLGELATLKHEKSYVIRAGWMFGSGAKDKKFIKKILELAVKGEKLYIVNDKKGTPTYTDDFSKGIKRLIESKRYGVYNQVCEGYTDRLEVAKELLKNLNLNNEIEEVSSDYFKRFYYAYRPDNESLKNSDCIEMRNWKDCLKEYCENTLKYMI